MKAQGKAPYKSKRNATPKGKGKDKGKGKGKSKGKGKGKGKEKGKRKRCFVVQVTNGKAKEPVSVCPTMVEGWWCPFGQSCWYSHTDSLVKQARQDSGIKYTLANARIRTSPTSEEERIPLQDEEQEYTCDVCDQDNINMTICVF